MFRYSKILSIEFVLIVDRLFFSMNIFIFMQVINSQSKSLIIYVL